MRKKMCMLLALFVVFLAGCDLSLDDEVIHTEAAAVLEGIAAGDYAAARAGLNQRIPDAEVCENLQILHEYLAELGEYEMTAVGMNRKIENDLGWTAIRYLVTSGEMQFYLEVMKIDDEPGLAGFNLTELSGDAPSPESRGLLHWGFTILGVAAGIFALWMLADCVRRKPKHRWAWALLILLMSAMLTVSSQDGRFAFQFNAGLYLGLSSLTTYASGDFSAQLYFPLGALIYWIMRRRLLDPDLASDPAPLSGPENPALEE